MTQTRRLSGAEVFDRLELMVWGDHQHVAALTVGQSLVIGREAPAHLRLAADGLSRRHARIAWDSTGPEVEDLGSTNGTKLNGLPITGRQALAPGDLLQLGEVRISISGRRDGEAAGPLIDSYERFVGRIDDELTRARLFGRSFGVLRLRPLAPAHVSRFTGSVLEVLRPVDRLGAFGSSELLVLLPEADEATTRQLGKLVRTKSAIPLVISTCVFPGDGADAQSLLAVLASGVNTLKRGQTLAHSTKAVHPHAGPLVSSERMRALFATAKRVAGTRIPVMINGETGSGKEVLARAVHEGSPRIASPFVAVNCAAIAPTLLESTLFGHERGAFTGADRRSRGLFEQADGGTIFLDEVGELSPAAQAALLRVLETQRFFRVGGEQDVKVDVRVLAATHRNLEQAVLAGTFRADLRFRLEGVTLVVPPLRERADEIVPLALRFLEEVAASMGRKVEGFTPAALTAMSGYAWPGNIRELRNVVERAVVIAPGTRIEVSDLPENVVQRRAVLAESGPVAAEPELPPDTALQAFVTQQQHNLERRLITRALEQCGGNQTKTAKLLKLPLRTLVHKLKALELR